MTAGRLRPVVPDGGSSLLDNLSNLLLGSQVDQHPAGSNPFHQESQGCRSVVAGSSLGLERVLPGRG